MEFYYGILSSLILLLSFILIANKRVTSYIKTFRFQSILICILVGVIATQSAIKGEGFHAFILFAMILVLKVIYIPHLLRKAFANTMYIVSKDFFFNIPLLIIVSWGLVIFSFFTLSTVEGINHGELRYLMVNSVSVVLIGLLFMISRRKAIGQIIGFLVVENGLFVAAMFATHGMPMIVDVGIFIDLITAVLIMGLLVFRINETFESTDTNHLKKLRG